MVRTRITLSITELRFSISGSTRRSRGQRNTTTTMRNRGSSVRDVRRAATSSARSIAPTRSYPLAESSPRRVDAEGKCNGRGGRESPARQVPLAFGHNAINPGGLGAEPPRRTASFVHSFTKLNLTNVYATYAEPKQTFAQLDPAGRRRLVRAAREALGGCFTQNADE